MLTIPRLLLTAAMAAALASHVFALDFYVGTYTKPGASQGIYHFQMDAKTGKVSGGELAADSSNPSYLAMHPGGKFLYAVNENNTGTASAFSIGADSRLTPINQKSSRGSGPCHICLDKTGRNALVANYGSGTVAVLPIHENGELGEAVGVDRLTGSSINRERQEAPHAHGMCLDRAGTHAYACDLGTDWIHAYRFDAAKSAIVPDPKASIRVTPGAGPRHIALHPRQDFMYAINELNSTISAFAQNPADGSLQSLQSISTLPADFKGQSTTAEIVIHPGGKFLYGSNRGHDSIAAFSIAPDGHLSLVSHTPTGGKTPRNIALDPAGRWLLASNQDTNDIFVFKVDQETGKLAPTGQRVELSMPVCVVFAGARPE